ncbi:MAG: peroxide stress protein YaaA, partial [Burkholderiaceae bacterium]|nr:peroxide stress protein YaaA [Burkholderiaceae bacterium]
MLIVLSPAKSLDYESPISTKKHTLPDFVAESAKLIADLKKLSPQQVSKLMGISDPLAALNVGRYRDWSKTFTSGNSRPALLAFNGDVYEGFDAKSL